MLTNTYGNRGISGITAFKSVPLYEMIKLGGVLYLHRVNSFCIPGHLSGRYPLLDCVHSVSVSVFGRLYLMYHVNIRPSSDFTLLYQSD